MRENRLKSIKIMDLHKLLPSFNLIQCPPTGRYIPACDDEDDEVDPNHPDHPHPIQPVVLVLGRYALKLFASISKSLRICSRRIHCYR